MDQTALRSAPVAARRPVYTHSALRNHAPPPLTMTPPVTPRSAGPPTHCSAKTERDGVKLSEDSLPNSYHQRPMTPGVLPGLPAAPVVVTLSRPSTSSISKEPGITSVS